MSPALTFWWGRHPTGAFVLRRLRSAANAGRSDDGVALSIVAIHETNASSPSAGLR